MQQVLAISLQGMHQDLSRMEKIGMNLTNTMTPGYKREVAVVRPFADYVAGTPLQVEAGIESFSDQRSGALKSTGQKLDLALASNGFFEISTDKGPAYTRQGNFHVDARGRLVTQQGYPVMGKGGEILLGNGEPMIDTVGNITVADLQGGPAASRPLAQLKIVQFDNADKLQRLGGGLFAAGAESAAMRDADIQIMQGYIENSNVSSMQEMMQLMQTMRHFESLHKVAQGYDDMIGTAIRKLSDT